LGGRRWGTSLADPYPKKRGTGLGGSYYCKKGSLGGKNRGGGNKRGLTKDTEKNKS